MVGARMANLKVGNPKFSDAISSMETIARPAVTIERAAELSGSTTANIKRAKPIVTTGITELQDMVDSGEASTASTASTTSTSKAKSPDSPT
jgi:hypothetical protein